MTPQNIVLSGREFTTEEINLVKEYTENFKRLSRTELARTICENISWLRPNGAHKIDSCLVALEKLEKQGQIKLSPKEPRVSRNRNPAVVWTERTVAGEELAGDLKNIFPIELRVVSHKDDRFLWNEYVDRYHYLRYKRPIGSHLRYFIVAPKLNGMILGCLLFSASSWSLDSRDRFIGWNHEHREKFLHLVINNSRFLIFPWVRVPNLASHVLSLAAKQVKVDWQKSFSFSPALLETFVDTSRYTGNCYKAANWQLVGETSGKERMDRLANSTKGVKKVFLFPLESDFSEILMGKKSLKKKVQKKLSLFKRRAGGSTRELDDGFINLWKKICGIVSEVAEEYDRKWQKRKRILNSLFIILIIFRLICSNRRGYGTIISELWDNCSDLGLGLPQRRPIAASSLSDARMKLDAEVFKTINKRIIAEYEPTEGEDYRWKGHRIFAVDGSKIFVPRTLFALGFKSWTFNKHYPQALVSCLYQLKSQIPFDFAMSAVQDERKCAIDHLTALRKDDIVVYDRGYFSYELFYQHTQIGIHAIFRLPENICADFDNFKLSDKTDSIITLAPSKPRLKELQTSFPALRNVKARLIKYSIEGTTYCLATTLLSDQYSALDFSDAYHSRWGIEELYKISKNIFNIEDFHAKHEMGIKQEIFAHFTLITMNRIFANKSETNINADFLNLGNARQGQKWKINFKNCVATMSRKLERLFLATNFVKDTVTKVYKSISNLYSQVRPHRQYPRVSMQPAKKWRDTKHKGPLLGSMHQQTA